MRNKIVIIFLIILNFIFFKAYADDQISFDVTEIEILDGGNKIIGKNRGTISTNSGIIVKADEFEFDKTANAGPAIIVSLYAAKIHIFPSASYAKGDCILAAF